MTAPPERLSVPPVRRTPPRPLTDAERVTCAQVADVLCTGPGTTGPRPSGSTDFQQQLDLAVATRCDAFDGFVAVVAAAAAATDLAGWLRSLHASDPGAFALLSTVVAGAYLMIPEVRELVGYPGQHRDRPDLEQAVEELTDGILDPVVERGPIYVPTPGLERQG